MSTLAALKLTNARKPTQQPPIVQSRNKLARRIWEQRELARAQAEGSSYSSKKLKSIVDIDGVRKTVEVNKRIKPWWFVADNGKVCIHIRYGSKVVSWRRAKRQWS